MRNWTILETVLQKVVTAHKKRHFAGKRLGCGDRSWQSYGRCPAGPKHCGSEGWLRAAPYINGIFMAQQ